MRLKRAMSAVLAACVICLPGMAAARTGTHCEPVPQTCSVFDAGVADRDPKAARDTGGSHEYDAGSESAVITPSTESGGAVIIPCTQDGYQAKGTSEVPSRSGPARKRTASRAEVSDDGFEYEENSIGGVTITKYNGSASSVIIPSKINDKPVTMIGSAFRKNTLLESVAIPSSVTSIGSSAFYGCSSLTSVTIPDSVTSIESYAFYGCSSLTSVTIPSSVIFIESWPSTTAVH